MSIQKAASETFPAILAKESAKEAAIATNAVKREYEHKVALSEKDHTAATQVFNNTIENLRNEIARLQTANTAYEQRAAASDDKVRAIAEKALETAGNQQTISTMRDFVGSRDNGAANRSKS